MFRIHDRQTGLYLDFETLTWVDIDKATVKEGRGIDMNDPLFKDIDEIFKQDYKRFITVGALGTVEDSIRDTKFNEVCMDIFNPWDPREVAKLLVFHLENPTKQMIISKPDPFDDTAWVEEVRKKSGFYNQPQDFDVDVAVKMQEEKAKELLDELMADLARLKLSPTPAPFDFMAFEDNEGFVARLARNDVRSLPKLYRKFTDAGFDEAYIRYQADNHVNHLLYGEDKTNAE